MPPPDPAVRDAVLRDFAVSRETTARLDGFVALLGRWQERTNLVAANELPQVWTRHVADSLQFAPLAPAAKRWVDLGSGGGFPGVVVAIARAGEPGFHLTLVESNAKKAAFLRAAITELALPARVANARIEACGEVLGAADAVSARALAGLDALLDLVAGRVRPQVPCFFAKGRGGAQEIVDAERRWRFCSRQHPSRVEAGAFILEVSHVAPRMAGDAGG